jgi:uncharacterized damage-inducible protein DinB
MESREMDRSGISLRDHVDAVVAAIDAVPGDEKVVLVGHSAAAGIAHAALDARPDRVARAIYIGGFPAGRGDTVAGAFATENGEMPLPEWSQFAEEDLRDLDDEALAAFRERAIPSPANLSRDFQQLRDERRYDVPVTVIATEFSSADLQSWIEAGEPSLQELAAIRDVQYVDLPTGHWPQFTRPEDLGRAILDAMASHTGDALTTQVDDHGRPEPPLAADEAATLLGFLDYQRATLAWKAGGLDAAGLNTSVGASSMTLGGMLKHLAVVEDYWFTDRLLGREMPAPWNAVDWDADPDWDWHSAAEDSPEALFSLWHEAMDRSRSAVEEALAAGGLDQPARHPFPDGQAPSMRWILCHMIEEYARHNGHADLIRESVDGEVGE